MNRLEGIRDFFQENGLNLLIMVVIIAVGTGYFMFYTSAIAPNVANRDKLIAQLADARRSLGDARKLADRNPADYQKQLTDVQAALATSRSAFLTEAQTSQVPDALYQKANASRVTITDLQSQPAMTQTNKSLLSVTSIRLQAQGDSHQLVDFVSRLKEAALKGFIINNLNLTQDKTTAKLTMDITLFTSPVVPGDLRLAAQSAPAKSPTVVPTQSPAVVVPQVTPTAIILPTLALPPPLPIATPIPPTPVPPPPTPQYTIYIVRYGDTMYSLARRYGVTIEAIMAANRLPTYDIWAGQTLLIPNR